MTHKPPPLLVCCQGGSPGARLAGQTAAALEQVATAERVDDIDLLVRRARAGRAVIALDGCSSGCSARLLEARGVRPRLALDLATLGAQARHAEGAETAELARAVAARIHAPAARMPGTRPPRPARPTPVAQRKRVHGVEDYLLAIDALSCGVVRCGALAAEAPALAAHVSRMLSVSRPSAGQMLARLQASGLIERSPHKELTLTATGRLAADRAVRRHRLLERLASGFLGYAPADSYAHARLLDGAFDDDAIERVRRALGDPERCPHGWPIDPVRSRAQGCELSTLATLTAGERATVMRLVEHDAPALARLYALGLAPGTRVALAPAGTEAKPGVRRGAPGEHELHLRVGSKTRTIDPQDATKVLIRR